MNIRKNTAALVISALLAALTVTGCASAQTDTADKPQANDMQQTAMPETNITEGSEIMNMTVYDLSGTEIRLGDMISQNKVTMLNFWGTFCGPCIQEMPSLGELERQYNNSGFEILGMTGDIMGPDGQIQDDLVRDAEDIIADTGIDYPVLIAGYDILAYTNLYAFPTTYFVDSNGNMLTEPIIGSQSKEAWESQITELLAE